MHSEVETVGADETTGQELSSRLINVNVKERWASVIAGGALAVWGLKRRGVFGWSLAALAGVLLKRGVTGACPVYRVFGMTSMPEEPALVTVTTEEPEARTLLRGKLRIEQQVTIARPREEVYRFWRSFENLPSFMRHLERIIVHNGRSHWVAKGPGGKRYEWDAVITGEHPNEYIAWRTDQPSKLGIIGNVAFRDAPGDRGTEVKLVLEFDAFGRKVEPAVKKLFGKEPELEIREDLRRFKQLLEAGEIPSSSGPSARH